MKKFGFVLAAFLAGVALTVLGHQLLQNKSRENAIVTIEQIKDVAKLATIDYIGYVREPYEAPREWYEWKTAKLFVEINGTVEGLVDLDKITMERSGEKKDVVTIKIPQDAIVIQGPIIDREKGIKITTVSDPNIFHKLTDTQRSDTLNQATARLKQTAIESGIKEKTLAQAKQVITQFLAKSGVEVKFSA